MLADRDVQRRYIEGIVARAGVALGAAAAWLLVAIERDPAADIDALARRQGVPADRAQAALIELRERGLVVEQPPQDGGRPRRALTAHGCAVLGQLVAARRARLEELFGEWSPEQREEVALLLARLARQLVPEAPRVVEAR